MTGGLGRWWATRSITLRLTVIATGVLAAGLVSGTATLATLFFHSRVDAVDADVRTQAATVTELVESGQLPDPLPDPALQPAIAQVVDGAGTVLAATSSASQVVPVLPPGVLRSAEPGRPFTTTSSALGAAPLRVEVAPAELRGRPVLVVSAVPLTGVRETLDALLVVLLLAVPIVLIAAALATWLAVRSALRPVDELRAAADAVARTPSSAGSGLPLPDGADEITRLADTLNRMLLRVHRANEQQQAFIADAAHELRSPLASMRTQLDVALETPTDGEEWTAVAVDLRSDVERMARLADDLLLLARLDASVPEPRQPVDVTDVLGLAGSPVWAEIDPRGLRRAVENLVTNARRHAVSQVEVAATLSGSDVVVTVDDDGPGVPVQDRERVFGRWIRLDAGRARDDGGSGLGLSIARAVARSHGGDVVLVDSPLGGVRAELRVPSL